MPENPAVQANKMLSKQKKYPGSDQQSWLENGPFEDVPGYPETNSKFAPEKMPIPKGNNRLPTIHFQVQAVNSGADDVPIENGEVFQPAMLVNTGGSQ